MDAVKDGGVTRAYVNLGRPGAITKNGTGGSNWSYLEASERLEVLRVSQGHYGGWVWDSGRETGS